MSTLPSPRHAAEPWTPEPRAGSARDFTRHLAFQAPGIGSLTLQATPRGIVALHFEGPGGSGARGGKAAQEPQSAQHPQHLEADGHLEAAQHFLAWALDPERARSPLPGRAAPPFPALDLAAARGATPFRRRVWEALLGVGRGEVVSYGELSRRVEAGSPRAVGQAVGANPIPILVPCHRVVTTGGRLGGFSGGLERKVALLTLEGFAPLEADFRARLNRAPARP